MQCWCGVPAGSGQPPHHDWCRGGPAGQPVKEFARCLHTTALSRSPTLHAAATSPTHQQQVVNERRKEAVDRFQRDSRVRAALLSITAAGVRALPAKLSARCSLSVCIAQQCGAALPSKARLNVGPSRPHRLVTQAGLVAPADRPARRLFTFQPPSPACRSASLLLKRPWWCLLSCSGTLAC